MSSSCSWSRLSVTSNLINCADLDTFVFAEPNDRFWAHEWECHGTCTKLGQAQFFRTVLDLNQKYNLEVGAATMQHSRMLYT